MITFSDIVGHQQPLEILAKGLGSSRLHHSLLFHGPDSVGKRTVAMALAAAVNCKARPDASVDACGSCASCGKVDNGSHPDVRYVTLEKTVIPIDAIRKLREEAAYRPFEGAARVFIVDPADRLSVDAQNALLKTLEEPSSAVRIVLVTSRPMHLLPTTRSRCQSIAFGTIDATTLASRLEIARGLSRADAVRTTRITGGRYGAAMQLDLEEHDTARDRLLEVLEKLAAGGSRDHVPGDAEAFGTEPEGIANRLDMISGLLRDMLILSGGAAQEMLIHPDRKDRIESLGRQFSSDVGVLLDRVRLARSDLYRNVNRRLLVETLLFDIADKRAARGLRV